MKYYNYILPLFIAFSSVNVYAQRMMVGTEKFSDATDPVILKLYQGNGPFAKYNPAMEEIGMRSESSKHFKNADGSYTSLFFSGYCHYKENGVWKTSVNTVIENKDAQYPYANLHNQVKTYYGKSATGIKFKWNNGKEASGFTPVSFGTLNESSKTEQRLIETATANPLVMGDNKVFYKNIAQDVDYTVEQLTGMVRTTYTLHKNITQNIPAGNDYLVIKERINLPAGATVGYTKEERSGKKIIQVMNGNEPLFTYSDVYYFDDSIGKMKPFHDAADFEYTAKGTEMEVSIKIPVAWLNNPNTKYPVTIDPTVNITPTNSAWWTGTMENGGSGFNEIIAVGFYDCEGCTDIDYRGWIKLNLAGLPDYACVTAAEFYMWQNYWNNGGGDDGCRWDMGWANVEAVSAPWATMINAIDNLAERYVTWDVWGTPGACGGCSGGYDYPEGPSGVWKTFNFGPNTNVRSRLKQLTTQDYMTIGLDLTHHASDCFWCWGDESNWLRWDGYASGNRPYISLTHNDAPASTTWTGSINTDWYNNGNWTNCVPASNTVTTIPNTTNKPSINAGNAYSYTISIADGAVVTINSTNGAVLNVTQP